MAAASLRPLALFTFLLLFLLIAPRPSSSRPINGFLSAENIALPSDVDRELAPPTTPECSGGVDHASPLNSATTTKGEQELVAAPVMASRQQQLAEKYTPLLLSFLPRGPVPPSGPDPGINDIKP